MHILIKCLFALGPVSVNIPFDYDQEHLNTKIYIDRHGYIITIIIAIIMIILIIMRKTTNSSKIKMNKYKTFKVIYEGYKYTFI